MPIWGPDRTPIDTYLRIKISEAALAPTQDHSRDRNRNVDGQQGA